MDWWKCHHGAPLDPKILAIARRAEAPPAVACAMTWALFDHASQQRPRGAVDGFDVEGFAVLYGVDLAVCGRIFEAMTKIARPIHDGRRLMAWNARQNPKSDSTGAVRQQRHRDRIKAAKSAGTSRDVALRNDVTNAITPSNGHREEQELFSALDSGSAVTPPNIESVRAGSTVQRAPGREHTLGVSEGEAQSRGVMRSLRRFWGTP
jgi:hypothetical protein